MDIHCKRKANLFIHWYKQTLIASSYISFFNNKDKKNKISGVLLAEKFKLAFLSPLLFRDLDKIDDLMHDITEQQDVAQEISEAISRPFGETFDEVDTF